MPTGGLGGGGGRLAQTLKTKFVARVVLQEELFKTETVSKDFCWCKFCASLVCFFPGAFVWCFLQNGAPSWCKSCVHVVLIVGAKCVLRCFFSLKNGAHSRCKICSCCRSSPVERENDLAGWLKFLWCWLGQLVQNLSGWWFQPLWKILVSWDDYSQYMEKIKNVPNHQPVVFIWYCFFQNCVRSWCKGRAGGGMCGGCEVLWSGRVVWHRVN